MAGLCRLSRCTSLGNFARCTRPHPRALNYYLVAHAVRLFVVNTRKIRQVLGDGHPFQSVFTGGFTEFWGMYARARETAT